MTKILLKDCTLNIPIFGSSSRLLKKTIIYDILSIKGKSSDVQFVTALKNLNLEIAENDKIGILGKNGSGKTTLLRLIAGIYPVTSGEIQIDGKINALLNLDVGFENEASGIENIEIYFARLNREMKKNDLEKIINIADLGNFINLPVKTYSSGMRMKLAFALIINFNCEILLLDEWLAVGDKSFREKSNKILKEKIKDLKILLFASHSTDMIIKNCNKVLILDKGNIVFFGPTDQGIKIYNTENTKK